MVGNPTLRVNQYKDTSRRVDFSKEIAFISTTKIKYHKYEYSVLNGGHHVPENDIIRRFYRSKEMFWTVYKMLVDKWTVYYNSDEVFEKIATDEMVYDNAKWKNFRKDIV